MTTIQWPDPKYSATDTWWKSWRLRQVPHWGTITINVPTEHAGIVHDHRLIIPEHPSTANAIAALLYVGYRVRHHVGLATTTESPTGVVSTMYIPDKHQYEIASHHGGRPITWHKIVKSILPGKELIDIDHRLRHAIMLQPLSNIYPVVAAQNPPYYPPRSMEFNLFDDPVWAGAIDALADRHTASPDPDFVD